MNRPIFFIYFSKLYAKYVILFHSRSIYGANVETFEPYPQNYMGDYLFNYVLFCTQLV